MREVYSKKALQGFESSKVETVSSSSDGTSLFVGTGEGLLVHYHCFHHGSTTKGFYGCKKHIHIKEKKPIFSLKVVESWGVVMCICDNHVMVFDLESLQPLNPMPETKGANLFCVNERLSLLCVGMRHKFKVFSWQPGVKGVLVGTLASGFSLRKEFPSPESPRALICTSGCIIAGYKKHYDAFDVQSYTCSHLVDFDREHKLISLELPASSLRKVPAVLLSVGIQGVLVDVFGNEVSNEERIEWNSVPISSCYAASFIISILQGDVIEIHDVGTLASLQKIKCSGASLTGLCSLDVGPVISGNASGSDSVVACGGTAFICAQDNTQVLEMIPLHIQVTRLVEAGDLEGALSICHANKGNSALFDEINLQSIHEKFGSVLYQKGDFDGAVDNYLAADSSITDVFSLFPDLIPPTVTSLLPAMDKRIDSVTGKQTILGVTVPSTNGNRLSGAILHRAAAAIVHYCERKRPQVSADADQAEYRSRISLSSNATGYGGSASSNKAALMELLAEKAENIVPGSSEDLIRKSVLLDTVLVCSLVSSSPLSSTRRQSVIDVLSDPKGNRCHIESCAVLLASQGNTFTEALLWLYRSHNEHRRVLSALTEDRCVGSGAWTKEEFYEWMASYLQWMWFGGTSGQEGASEGGDEKTNRPVSSRIENSSGASIESMVLPTLKNLLQYDASLGLSVLTGLRSADLPRLDNLPVLSGKLDESGSRGDVSFEDVIVFLQEVSKPGRELTSGSSGWDFCRVFPSSGGASCPMANIPLPLVNGHTLAVAYAEWVVDQLTNPAFKKSSNTSSMTGVSGGSSSLINAAGKLTILDIVEEYARLLMDGIKSCLSENQVKELNYSKNDLDVGPEDSQEVALFKIYRSKLQAFLQCERYDYRPERMMKNLPQGLLHEYALLLSRLGSHDDVLTIYIHQLGEPTAAEEYCDRMYAQSMKRKTLGTAHMFSGFNTADVYLSLIKAKLNLAVRSSSYDNDPIPVAEAIRQALQVAEKYFDRVDPCAVIDMLPPKSPVAMVQNFLERSIEHINSKKRSLQVIHQILRIREVNMQTADSDLQVPPIS